MKIWGIFVCVVLLLFCGCSRQTNDSSLYDSTGKWSSRIDGVANTENLACIGNTIAYNTNLYVCFYDTVTEKVITDDIPDWHQVLAVSAGEKYFYILMRDSSGAMETEPCKLRIYTVDGVLFKELEVPFQTIYVSDGMIYVYWGLGYELQSFDRRMGHIEATHYLSEKIFLADFPDKNSDWNEMEGDTLQIASKTFYRYPADGVIHKKSYYSDDKYLQEIQQLYFTQYMDGELATPPERAISSEYLEELYAMMKNRERNWITFASEVDGIMYGVCNVYTGASGFLSQMDTNCIDYSFSFFFNENTGTLEKINEYENVELIYVDGDHVLIHKEDGVYYIDQTISTEEKILDYDGAIGVTVRDNLLLVQKNESYIGNGDAKEEQEFYWGTDTIFVKKLNEITII